MDNNKNILLKSICGIKKFGVGVALTATIAATLAGTTSCAKPNIDNSIDTGVQQSQSYKQHDSTSTKTSQSEVKNSTSKDTSASKSTADTEYVESEGKYSRVLENVMTKQCYQDRIANPANYNKKYLDNIPFGFLEREGYDISKLATDDYSVIADMYVENGILNISCNVETKSSINYYTCYTGVCYKLTDKELADIDMLYTNKKVLDTTSYYQAAFFIQELTNIRKPDSIKTVAYMSVDALNKVTADISANCSEGKCNQVYFTEEIKPYEGDLSRNQDIRDYRLYVVSKSEFSEDDYEVKPRLSCSYRDYRSMTPKTEIVNGKLMYTNIDYDLLTIGMIDDKYFRKTRKSVYFYRVNTDNLEDITINNIIDMSQISAK